MARLWDMMSCAVVRERAHKALLATLAPRERVFAFVASVAARMGARGQGRLPPGLSGADMASYLEVPQEGIDAALHRGMPGQRGGAPH
jgi:CRP-like cAMP-binding protein